MKEIKVEIRAQSDIIVARRAGRDMARDLGFGSADQTRLATAISELTRNIIQYAGEGVCVITDESDKTTIKVRVKVEDNGPGIPDIDQAMEQGFSTARGLGAGLPGTKRLVQEFDIDSVPGHTIVIIAITQRKV
ncbi:MAG: anti-sigma regulatory factor [Deltaproteobacteria bacterium]|nr:anti-sigma regulatory factor [Deltaproteobacteria bacterium]MDL1961830.1 anti-sigma regulatory factor [Deltaproteobacteria bacterium]